MKPRRCRDASADANLSKLLVIKKELQRDGAPFWNRSSPICHVLSGAVRVLGEPSTRAGSGREGVSQMNIKSSICANRRWGRGQTRIFWCRLYFFPDFLMPVPPRGQKQKTLRKKKRHENKTTTFKPTVQQSSSLSKNKIETVKNLFWFHLEVWKKVGFCSWKQHHKEGTSHRDQSATFITIRHFLYVFVFFLMVLTFGPGVRQNKFYPSFSVRRNTITAVTRSPLQVFTHPEVLFQMLWPSAPPGPSVLLSASAYTPPHPVETHKKDLHYGTGDPIPPKNFKTC